MNLRIFASNFIRDLDLFNEEVAKIKEWCDLNKLFINIKKANWRRWIWLYHNLRASQSTRAKSIIGTYQLNNRVYLSRNYRLIVAPRSS